MVDGGGVTTTTGAETPHDVCQQALLDVAEEGPACPIGSMLMIVSGPESDGESVDPEDPEAGLDLGGGARLYLVDGPNDVVGHVYARGPECYTVCATCPLGFHACVVEFEGGGLFRQCIPLDDEDPVATCAGTDEIEGTESTGGADETG
ncbi:MAG: hypothetical protein AAF799_44310 [Myxococcota bacterium]